VVEKATNLHEKYIAFKQHNRAWINKVKKFTKHKPTKLSTKRYSAMISEIDHMCNRRAPLEDALVRAAAAYSKAIEEFHLGESEMSSGGETKKEASAEALVLT
jgi:hypothetical protein